MGRLFVAVAALASCGPRPVTPGQHNASTTAASVAAVHEEVPPLPPGLAPLEGSPLEKRGDIVFAPPIGATEPRPVVVVLHGAGDRPEWECNAWRVITQGYALVACPHGSPFGDAYAWSSLTELETRALAAEAAAHEHYASYVAAGPAILAGFSQGARLVSVVARKHPDHWPVVIVTEGGYDETKWAFGPAFAKGGKRILFACSTWHCAPGFADAAASSRAAKVDARVADFGNVGHHMGTNVQDHMREELRWLVRDDERWEAWLESPSGPYSEDHLK
jgi:pimeloyl-ACP methyl ester carboxylesterase